MTTIDSHLNIVRIPEKVDWLGYLIGVTKLISELAPLPCLSNVAVLVLSILEPLQVLKRNRILFKELAEKVVRITVRLRDEVIADTSIAASPKFVQTCVEFHDCLLRVTGDLKEILMPHRRSWAGQYFSAHLFRPVILNAQKRVDDLIESFLLATAVGTRLRVQLVHSDLTALRRALISAEVDAEPKVADFHELIPGDLQLLTPLQPQDTAEAQQESITDHPVLVRGVRMMARLYHGENALEVRQDCLQAFQTFIGDVFEPSNGAETCVYSPTSGMHTRFSCLGIASLHVSLHWFSIRVAQPPQTTAKPSVTRTREARAFATGNRKCPTTEQAQHWQIPTASAAVDVAAADRRQQRFTNVF